MKLYKSLSIFLLFFICLFPIVSYANDNAKLNFTPLFAPLSDAMGAVKQNNTQQAKDDLIVIEKELNNIGKDTNRQSILYQETITALNHAKANPNNDTLKELSIKLYAYEKEQNPVDYGIKRRQFTKNITPVLNELDTAIQEMGKGGDIERVKSVYHTFNKTWVANERVVRNTSMAHYGKIETAMAMIRVGAENNPPNIAMMTDNMAILKSVIDSYNQGDELTEIKNDKVDLVYGAELLKQGLTAFKNNDKAAAQAKLGEFIQIWASIEGDVRTRDAKLYAEIESDVPVIMAKGDTASVDKLANLIERLQAINPNARYSWVDAMLILLREGLEALLIVMALLTALTVAGQPKGKKLVMAGVGTGLVASLVGAWALVRLFPTLTSGANREALEGAVGIVAVVMMIGVGAWLHSKSSVKAWNAYINKHMGVALSTGSMAGLFGLAFLSVFREGAETVLFYAGILPSIAMSEFVLGIAVALGVLFVVAVVMAKTSVKLPIPLLFKILTWLIYALGFKILGVSISALQLTGHLPRDVVDVPSVAFLGIYPSVQGLAVQAVYVTICILVWLTSVRKSVK